MTNRSVIARSACREAGNDEAILEFLKKIATIPFGLSQ